MTEEIIRELSVSEDNLFPVSNESGALAETLVINEATAIQPVSLVGDEKSAEDNLYRNLYATLHSYFRFEAPVRPPRYIWMPLFGTIDGILSPEKSAAIIGAVLERFPVDIPKEYDTSGLEDITIWIRGRMDQKKYSQISDTILRYDIQPPEGLQPDDLTRIKGIGEALAAQLKKNDIRSFEQIANWSNQDIIEFSERSGISERRIFSNDWVAQAKALIGEPSENGNDAQDHSDVTDETRFLDDLPAEEDELGRQAVAVSVAQNVRAVWQHHQDAKRPFIVHLSGRWGSGKSSILNFLETELRDKKDNKTPWVVINFNAWTHHEDAEVWWALLNEVARNAPGQLVFPRNLYVGLRHIAWKFLTGWWTLISGLAVVVGVYWFFAWSDPAVETQVTNKAGTTTTTTTDVSDPTPSTVETRPATGEADAPPVALDAQRTVTQEVQIVETPPVKVRTIDRVKEFGGLVTALLGLGALFGQFYYRRNKTAEAIQALDSEPSRPLHRQFRKLISRIERPVAVFIDDLDRCDAAYVVKLLQAIQNVYSDVPVLYVVAADRDWIVSSYAQVYSEFGDDLSEPGRPLGHLFVEKIFQLSVNVPDLGVGAQREYLKRKLGSTSTEQKKNDATQEVDDETSQALQATATQLSQRPEELVEFVKSQETPELKRAAGRASFATATSRVAERALTHRLLEFADLVDPNPRAIKRLVNAYAFRFGFMLLAGETDALEKLPRWCILEQRFPYSAKRLGERPDLMVNDAWTSGAEAAFFPVPTLIRDILGDLTQEDVETLRRFG